MPMCVECMDACIFACLWHICARVCTRKHGSMHMETCSPLSVSPSWSWRVSSVLASHFTPSFLSLPADLGVCKWLLYLIHLYVRSRDPQVHMWILRSACIYRVIPLSAQLFLELPCGLSTHFYIFKNIPKVNTWILFEKLLDRVPRLSWQ